MTRPSKPWVDRAPVEAVTHEPQPYICAGDVPTLPPQPVPPEPDRPPTWPPSVPDGGGVC